jgi:UTP---glucose-1-phosphate uridylyltransferase
MDAIREALKSCCLPGVLINMKTKAPFINAEGRRSEVPAGRLEGTMQNIADCIVDCFDERLDPGQYARLSAYLTFNERHKTLSVAKSSAGGKGRWVGTPQGCFYELMLNHRDLLVNHCGMVLPPLPALDAFWESAPPFIIQIHPAAGPFYSVIRQKIRGGHLEPNSYLQLELAEVDIQNLSLAGSLQVRSDRPIGQLDDRRTLVYSELSGRCTLHNVTVRNAGMAEQPDQRYWDGTVVNREAVVIEIHGTGEFVAKDVTFTGPHTIHVADNERVTALNDSHGSITLRREKLSGPSWHWQYTVDADDRIHLTRR